MQHRFLILACVSLFLGLSVAGCTYEPAFKNSSFGTQQQRHDLSHYTYNAADDLMRQIRGSITGDTPLLVGTISNVNHVESSNTFGRATTEQVSARFAQRGYFVSETKLRNSVNIQDAPHHGEAQAGEFLISRDIRAIDGEHRAAAIISGTYAVAEYEVLVNLKAMDVASGSILGSVDYVVPRDSNIDALVRSGSGSSFFDAPLTY